MLISRASELAIRATLYMALQLPGKVSPVHEIAEGTGLPAPYLAKIVRRLVSAGLVRAFRGPGGGVRLGRPAEAISLWLLVRAMEGPAETETCLLGLRACSPEQSCPLHRSWASLRLQIQRLLEETTLASIALGLGEKADLSSDSWLRVAERRAAKSARAAERAGPVPATAAVALQDGEQP